MPIEIPQELRDNEPYKREGLYSIAGWASTWDMGGRVEYAMAWGGYFKKDTRTGTLEGQLNDEHGPSTIIGEMDPEHLEFNKYYYNRYPQLERSLSYSFTQNGNGLWEGRFTMEEMTGRAACKVQLVFDDAFRISFVGPRNINPPWTRFGI